MLFSINPATNQIIHQYEPYSWKRIEEFLILAAQAQRAWHERDIVERAICMQRLAHLLREHQHEAAHLMAIEMGKPVQQGLAEVQKCAATCEYFAAEAASMLSALPLQSSYAESYARFDPLGVVLAIMPWNFPFWQVIRAVVPALMAGNTVVLKHSPEICGCALMLERLLVEAGMGEGVFGCILATVESTSAAIAHRAVAAVTFTGSTRAGRSVAALAGQHLKKTVLELGGSDAYCVLDDADVQLAARVCASSRLVNTGQSCVAAKRFIVSSRLRQEFQEEFVRHIAAARVGDPLLEQTEVGPIARLDLRDLLQRQVDDSVALGASVLLAGGTTSNGCYFKPMVLGNVRAGMPAYDEELFGPAAAIIDAADDVEIVRIANDSIYGLGAAVFTTDASRGERVAAELDAGCVFINDFVKSDARFPFGGVKASGWGRELSAFGIREFVNIKSVVVA